MKIVNKKAFIVQVLRRGSYRWPPRNEAMKRARIARGVYKCESCQTEVGRKDVSLDHIISVVPLSGFTTWDEYIERMYCDADGFACICNPCHDAKTAAERVIRNQHKQQKKLTGGKKRAKIKHVVKRSRNKKV